MAKLWVSAKSSPASPCEVNWGMLRRAILHNQRWGRELCAYFSCLRPTEPVRPGQMGHSGADGRNSHNLGTGILTAATNLNSRETKLARTQAASDEGGRYETRQPEAIRADPGQRGAGPDRFSGGCAGTCVDAGDTEEARAAGNAGEAVRSAAATGRGAQARAKA